MNEPSVRTQGRPEHAVAEAAPWWRTAVFYENHMASLRDGDGDGTGDIRGLIEALDYLAGTLGVSAVWLSPCFRSPLLDQGFDISDFCDIEPVFGTMADFDRLVAEAHRRGVRLLADYVPNHTSDQHPWFVASRSSRDDPKRDWYVWRDPGPDGSPPNNWVSEAGGSTWEFDPRTGQYYLHSHLKEQPDLNWRNAEVVEAMLDVLRFWLDRGVDGFRIDVAHMLMKDPELRDNPVQPAAERNVYDVQHDDFGSQKHIHDRLHPDVHGVLRAIRAVVDEYPDRVLVGEIEAMGWSDWASFFGADQDEIHMPFAFRLIETPWRAADLARELDDLDAATPDDAWPILALGNHDRPRLATRLGRDQARVAAMLLLTLRGTPIIFYGDELGMPDQDVPRERQRDTFGLTPGGRSRDPIRTPMPWDDGPNAGFSTAPARDLWLPVSAEAATLNVAAQLADPGSLLCLYRSLIALRRDSAALREGSYRGLPGAPEGCLTYERRAGSDHKIVMLNLTGRPLRVPLPGAATVVLSTADRGRTGARLTGALELAADEGVVLDADGGEGDGACP
ncbi:alpha-amylase family glycosyl hydrolase [Actinomadura mexicana]|uniref:Alpha-glucosidase n=1 Tax=Actinomadura mexicana TaxID=134959 RepID=A0A238USI5_9ACTN|nr:alpha-amylase family glycosyl hydrolase [Actinomadura mexicana]SNR24299.1 alpha-glucosidase [Actinomadura mexicana]